MDRVTRRMLNSLSSTQTIEETLPPQERHLKLLKEAERFEIRSHLPETSPTKLFVDSDGDDDYKVKPRSRELTPEKVLELEKKRRDIIKKQGQRKSLDIEDVINISNNFDQFDGSELDLTGVEGSQNKPNIHTEQINFESARKQFIMLEKEKNILPIMPRSQQRPSRLSTRSLHENYQVTKGQEDLKGKPPKDESFVTQEITENHMNSGLLRKQFFKTLSVDTVDNGEQEKSMLVSEEKSPQEIEEEKESIPNPSDETPIEREIRLALQREESLRKERGILGSGETKEIIEISKNPVFAIQSDIGVSTKSTDRASISFFLQREIEKEVQREAVLKSEGRVAGLYDKGIAQELDERRKLFEQPDEIPVQPQKGTSTKVIKETTSNIRGDTSQADLVTENDIKTVLDSPKPYSVRMKWKPTPSNAYRNRRLSSENILDIFTPLETTSEKETSEETFVLRKENFRVKPLKFGLPAQNNDGEVEVDHNLGHGERYTTWLRPSLSNIIEQEIQQTLERDRELQEERKKSGLTPLTIENENELNTPQNGYDTHGTPSLNSNVLNTLSSAPWKGTLGNKLPPYDDSNVHIFRPKGYPKFEMSESDGDRVKSPENSIVESTRVNRHKNTMALRWEAGLYANEQK
ncbi:mitotic interactor and substrate of PLK1 isoform X1 [Rhinoderma darwinii]|uniref:mitotic interactor and substrate of PLK1 isoform X1 n=1 Tax=Rhinoderma darwinii TaxID=43563 RepID=UPI003F67F95A